MDVGQNCRDFPKSMEIGVSTLSSLLIITKILKSKKVFGICLIVIAQIRIYSLVENQKCCINILCLVNKEIKSLTVGYMVGAQILSPTITFRLWWAKQRLLFS